MKHLLSYIFPVTKNIESKHSGMLEITWHNGKKHLNTKNANYSYGSLQRILKFGIENIDLKRVNSVLILGMGGGSVIQTLRTNFNYTNCIEAVEIDPVIIDIAATEFGISKNENLKIHCTDALEFIKQNTSHFDLIIVDLFIDLTVPNQVLSEVFWDNVLQSKSSKGAIIFNAAVMDAQHQAISTLVNYLKTKIYKVQVLEKVNNTNTLIILKSL